MFDERMMQEGVQCPQCNNVYTLQLDKKQHICESCGNVFDPNVGYIPNAS